MDKPNNVQAAADVGCHRLLGGQLVPDGGGVIAPRIRLVSI
jgi:hypothetical protein